MIYSFDRTRNIPGIQPATTGALDVETTLAMQMPPATPATTTHDLADQAGPATAAHDESGRKQAFETSLAIIFLRNSWFFSNLLDRSLLQVKEIVVPILRKVFLSRKYGKCFPEPSAAELALFNCFCQGDEVRTSYHAYQSLVATGSVAEGMAPVPRTPDEIQGFLDYYTGHVFARPDDRKSFDEKWMAIRSFGQFLKDPARFSARRITLDDIDFIDAGTAALVRETLRDGAQPATARNGERSACLQDGIAAGASVHTLGAAQLRRERHKRFGQPAQGKRFDLSPRSAAREQAYRHERRGQRCERSEDALLVSRIFGGLTDSADLQRISALSFSRTQMVGGENFHDTAMAASRFGAPYTPGDYASAIPDHWFDTLPELGLLKQQYPELI